MIKLAYIIHTTYEATWKRIIIASEREDIHNNTQTIYGSSQHSGFKRMLSQQQQYCVLYPLCQLNVSV